MIIVNYVINVDITRQKNNMDYDKINEYFRQLTKIVNLDYFDKIHYLMEYILGNCTNIPEDYPKNAFSIIDINDSI